MADDLAVGASILCFGPATPVKALIEFQIWPTGFDHHFATYKELLNTFGSGDLINRPLVLLPFALHSLRSIKKHGLARIGHNPHGLVFQP